MRNDRRLNRKTYSNNRSGIIGVHWCKKNHFWKATIVVNGKAIYLGIYDLFEDAVTARKQAEKEYLVDEPNR